jgi:hypothetical protein
MQHLLGQRGTDIDELNLIKLWVPMKQESGYSDERSVNSSITERCGRVGGKTIRACSSEISRTDAQQLNKNSKIFNKYND